jgi:hypothetical protein
MNPDELFQAYVEKHGLKHAMKVMGILGKNMDFIRAIETSVGDEIYKDVLERAGRIKAEYDNLILNNDIETDVKAMGHARKLIIKLQVYMDLINEWSGKINHYYKLSIKEEV